MENNDMSDLIKNFSQMLKDGNIPDNVKEIFNNLSNSFVSKFGFFTLVTIRALSILATFGLIK